MRFKEKLCERPLRRQLDGPTRDAIQSEFERRRHLIPVAAELHWDPARPELTIRSKWASFLIQFNAESLVVIVDLSLTAKVVATDEHRRRAIQIIEEVADELDL
jgi:hypothetical protein